MEARTRRKALTYAGLYLFLVLFFLLTVSSGDDFRRIAIAAEIQAGESSFWGRVLSFYQNTNGRFLGNSLHLLFSSSFVLNAFARAAIVLGILWGVARVARIRSLVALPVILLAVLVPAVPILKQAMVWSAGFYNYVVPVFLILLLVVLLRDVSARWKPVVVLPLAVAACLFMETVSVGLVVVSVVLLVSALIRHRATLSSVAFFVGSAVGAAVMFGSPVYGRVLSGDDAYRPMPGAGSGLLGSVVTRASENIPRLAEHLVLELAPLYLVVAILIALAAQTRNRRGILAGVLVGSATSLLLVREVGIGTLGGSLELLAATGILALFILWGATAAGLLWRSDITGALGAGWWIAGGVLIAGPLLIIAPFGPRNFFLSSVCVIIAACIAAAPLLNGFAQQKSRSLAVLLAAACAAATLLGVLAVNKVVSLQNAVSAEQQYLSGAEEITLRAYPFPALVHAERDGEKYLLSLQRLECAEGSCGRLRDVDVVFE